MTRMFFPLSFYPLKPWKYPSGYFFSKIKSPRTFYTRDDIYDYNYTYHSNLKLSWINVYMNDESASENPILYRLISPVWLTNQSAWLLSLF